MGKYKCNKCGKVVERESTKKWMLSYCEYSGLKARLYSCPESTLIEDSIDWD